MKKSCQMNKKNKYVLFHCHHLSTLHQFVWLRMTAYKSKTVVLMVNHKSFGESYFAQKLEATKVFERILTIQEPKNFNEKQWESFVLDYYDKYFQSNNLSFDEISEIYTACDLNNLFPIYCILNGRAISYLEMYAGQFADKERYRAGTDIFGYPFWLEQMSRKYNSLSGDGGKYTARRYLWIESDCEYPDKDIKIDFLKEFFSMPDSCKKQIISCMDVPMELDFGEVNMFLLNGTKWTNALTKLEMPYVYLPYLLVLDYYFGNQPNIIIKNHPHSEADEYFRNELLQNVEIIPQTLPIEFYGLLDKFHICRLISVESSGNKKIAPFVEDEIRLGTIFLESYSYLHKVFALYSIIKRIEKDVVFQTFGISYDFVKKFICYSKDLLKNEAIITPNEKISGSRKYYIIGSKDCTSKRKPLKYKVMEEDVVLCFFDNESVKAYLLDNPDVKQFITLSIKKQAIRPSCISDTDDEAVFIICKDEQYRKSLGKFRYTYKLSYTGLNIDVESDCTFGFNLKTKRNRRRAYQ